VWAAVTAAITVLQCPAFSSQGLLQWPAGVQSEGAEMKPGLIPLLVVLATLTSSGRCHKCYVCAPDNGKLEDITQLKKFFPHAHIPPCSKYKPHLKDQFLLECPASSSSGCLTKFEEDSVMRTCAPISFDECKTANSVQYCYCAQPGCNSPARKLSSGSEVLVSSVGSASAGHSAPAFASQIGTNWPQDDEDSVEGSADWGDFYYDEYNYGEEMEGGVRLEGFDDAEGGDAWEDVTDPPPYLDLEDAKVSDRDHDRHHGPKEGKHKFDRKQILEEIVNDIELVEDEDRERGKSRKGGKGHRPGGPTAGGVNTHTSLPNIIVVVCLCLLASCYTWRLL